MKTVILRSREVDIFGIYAYILTLVMVWTPQVVCNVFMRPPSKLSCVSGVPACLGHKKLDAKHYHGDW